MRPTVPFRARFERRLGVWCATLLVLGLSGCQMIGKGAPPSDIAAPTALHGPSVEVTSLPPLGATPAVAPPQQAEPAVSTPLPPEVPAAPIIVKSAGHLACEKRGGRFVLFGTSGAMTCQVPTRDGGKQCSRESECDGVCLARSNTCAPVKPLLGCQAILQNDGRRVELCID